MEFVVNSVYTLVWILRALASPNLVPYSSFSILGEHDFIIAGWIVYFSGYYETGDFLNQPLYIRIAIVLRCLRTWRFVRVFQVMRDWEIVALAPQGSMWELSILMVFFISGMFIFSTLIYYAEYSSTESS